MSLINEALKKAQRQRHQPVTSDAGSGSPTTHSIAKRGAPLRAQTWMVIFAAAAALIVVSVVVTVYLVNRPAPRPAPPTHPRPATPPPANLDTPSPVIIAPPLAPAPAPTPAAEPTRSMLPTTGATTEAPAAAVSAQAPASITPTPANGVVDVVAAQNFVDAIRVAGIRSSGNESKVLMNDRVYRVNDIVERALGLKLIKVSSDALTFADPNGTVYVKNF